MENKLLLKGRKKLLFLLCFLCVSMNSFGFIIKQHYLQTNDPSEKYVISYNTAFKFEFDGGTSWKITNIETNMVSTSGVGNLDVMFDTPGTYLITVSETINHNQGSCEHNHYPEKIMIEVSPYKLDFDFSTIKFSKGLKGGQSANGSTLKIDVFFSSYNNNTVVYNKIFKTAGVGTSVAGNIKDGGMTLQQGKNTLEFQLNGQATKDTYIMFDFVDVNDGVQSYGFTNKIQ